MFRFQKLANVLALSIVHFEKSSSYTITTERHLSSQLSGKSVAVIGGGYGGIGVAYHLRNSNAFVSLYDSSLAIQGGSTTNYPDCRGASEISAGQLHPLSPNGKMLWRGAESYATSLEIIDYVLKKEPSFSISSSGIIRSFRKKKEMDSFLKSAEKFKEVTFY